ncbi:MAG: exosortase U [Planctomycetales bacterium]|nr:exosortase U [Planctomycetales bacterium]
MIAIACAVPYALVYLFNLWGLAHYQFYPLLLGAVGYLGYQRWAGTRCTQRSCRWASAGLLLGGTVAILAAALFASPWMAYLSLTSFLASWLFSRRDAESGGSLGYLALPLLLIWQPPYSPAVNGDGILIARLQSYSALFASRTLDLLGIVHECPGTAIHCVGKSFGVEEACSGIQSFFSLLCFAALLIVFFRRPRIHSVLLLASSVFWAIAMNTLRITLIPVAYVALGIDLSHGLVHTLLGLSTMGLGLGLLISTDNLLGLLLPQWLGATTGPQAESPPAPQSSRLTPRWQWGLVPLFILVLGLQLYDIGASWGQQKKQIDFFSSDVLVDLAQEDGPGELAGWQAGSYQHEDRTRGADFGERSDLWHYHTPAGQVAVSLDQAFPGWHELTVCYTNMGWVLESRVLHTDEDGWPTVAARLRNQAGQYAFLWFSMFDESGQALQAPGDWSSLNALRERVKNRLSPSVRGTLFSLAAYQAQLFILTSEPLSQEMQAEMLDKFELSRERLRDATLNRMQDR